MHINEITLTPTSLLEGFEQIYHSVYGHEPHARYMGNQWYQVNGELMHRSTLMLEISRLHELETHRKARPHLPADKNIISRLINKLRGM